MADQLNIVIDIQGLSELQALVNTLQSTPANALTGGDITKQAEEIRKLVAEVEKLKNKQKEANKTIVDQEGILAKLTAQKKKLQADILGAKDLTSLKKLNTELQSVTTKIKTFNQLGKQSTNTWGTALNSFQMKFNTLGNFIGNGLYNAIVKAGSALTKAFKENADSFIESEKAAKKLQFAVLNIGKEGSDAADMLSKQSDALKGLFSDEQIKDAQTTLVNYGATARDVYSLIPTLIDYAAAANIELDEATTNVISAIEGKGTALKKLGIEINKDASDVEKLASIQEQLGKFSGSAAAALETEEGRLRAVANAADDAAEKYGKYSAKLKGFWATIKGEIATNVGVTIEAFEGLFDIIGGDSSKEAWEKFNSFVERSTFNLVSLRDSIDRVYATVDDFAKLMEKQYVTSSYGTQEYVNQLYKLYEESTATAKKYYAEQDYQMSTNAYKAANYYFSRYKAALNAYNATTVLNKDEADQFDAVAKSAKKASDEVKNYADTISKYLEEQIRPDLTQSFDDYVSEEKKKFEYTQAQLENIFNETTHTEEEITEFKINQLIEELKFAKQIYGEYSKEYYDANIALNQSLFDYKAELAQKSLELEEENAAKEKELREKLFEASVDYIDQEIEKYAEKIEKQQEAYDKEIELQQTNIDVQKSLAEKGLQNTLAIEMERQAKLEVLKQKEAKKLQRIEKARALFELLASYAKDGQAEMALPNALKDIGLASIASLGFKHGVVDLKGPGGTQTDSVLYPLSRGESVATAETTSKFKEELKAMNQGESEFMQVIRRKHGDEIMGVRSYERENSSFMQVAMVKKQDLVAEEIRKIYDELRSRPVSNVKIDNIGNVITSDIQKGFKKVRKYIRKQPRI